MRAPYFLVFAVSSLITGVALGQSNTTPVAPDDAVSRIFANERGGVVNAVRGFIAKLSVEGSPHPMQEIPPFNWIDRSVAIGEALPETVQTHPIPQHETYRYAVVNNHRVIVDATSRKVVYVIQ
jgi:hypothetical protein